MSEKPDDIAGDTHEVSDHAKAGTKFSVKDKTEFKRKQTGAIIRLTKKRNAVCSLMTDKGNLHLVKEEIGVFNDYVKLYQDAHMDLCDNLVSDDDIDMETSRFEERLKSIIEFRNQVSSWIRKAERHLTDEIDSASTKSSHASSVKSSISARAKERTRIAELLIDREMFHKVQHIQREAAQLRIEEELAKAKAREKIYAAEEHEVMRGFLVQSEDVQEQVGNIPVTESSPIINPINVPDQSKIQPTDVKESSKYSLLNDSDHSVLLNSNAKTFVPQKGVTVNSGSINSVTNPSNVFQSVPHSMPQNVPKDGDSVHSVVNPSALLATLSLPQPQIQSFSGDLVHYTTFINAFDSRIAPRVSSDADRLYYLTQYLIGEPREIVSGCLHLSPEVGYAEARHLLHKEYGDPYKLSMVYLKKINEWPVIRQDDNVGLKKFSLFLTSCNSAMQSLSYMHVLNNPCNMHSIWQKFPNYLQNKWREYVSKVRKREQQELYFPDMVQFVADAADVANDPVYEKTTRQDRTRYVQNTYQGKSKVTNFASSVSSDQTFKKYKCPLCQQAHLLENCEVFKGKSVEDKRTFLKEKRLCFGCFGTNHFTKGCINRLKCDVCGKRHPTLLHIDGYQHKVETITTNPSSIDLESVVPNSGKRNTSLDDAGTSAAIDVSDSVILHAILPVKVYQKGSDVPVTTYCFYDNGSSACFITNDLYERLNASGTETKLQLKTMHGKSYTSSIAVSNLVVTDLQDQNPINLPKSFTQEEIPVNSQHIPDPQKLHMWDHLRTIVSEIPEHMPNVDIGILIGINCPLALEPLQVIPTNGLGPFATRLRHGWSIYGPLLSKSSMNDEMCNRVFVQETDSFKEIITPASIMNMFEMDFNDHKVAKVPGECDMSLEDKRFIKLVEQSLKFEEGQYCVPLPFREENCVLPNNKVQALKRSEWQRKKMLRDNQYYEHYKTFIQKLLDNHYAEPVDSKHTEAELGKVWYLPHHGVYSPNKPGKIRVVFDCSAKFEGTSLNDHLLQGPDLANNLVGVLTRFRSEPIAFSGDIESMFYRVKVPENQRSYLRFLWWPGADLKQDIMEYQMNVHIFGAVSSPSIANYVLRLVGSKASSSVVKETIHQNFYVDDCLRSVATKEDAKQLIQELSTTCSNGGFRLTKFLSNCNEVIASIPKEEQAKELVYRELYTDPLPITKTLGVLWNVEKDQFGFSINIKDKPLTRRGILATVSSLYDPLGFVAPVILPAKQILQDLCKDKGLGWDSEVPTQYTTRWQQWLTELPQLENVSIQRCFKPENFGRVVSRQLHVFADGSSTGYGAVVYLRLSNKNNQHAVSFMAGKARLAPLKVLTIPRLELTAAVTSVRLACMIQREMTETLDIRFYTDSSTVLRYIANERHRLPIFVSNRIQVIREFSQIEQWYYIPSELNPADEASRGLTANRFIKSSQWISGPNFLSENEHLWPKEISKQFTQLNEQNSEPQCQSGFFASTIEVKNATERLISYFSDWNKLCKAVAVFLIVKRFLKDKIFLLPRNEQKEKKLKGNDYILKTQDIENAEYTVIKFVQQTEFSDIIKQLILPNNEVCDDSKWGRVLRKNKSNSLHKLSPYLEDGILRVGGRLRRASLPEPTKHPYILPRKNHVTDLIICHFHKKLGHAGRNHVLSEIRNKYWIIGGNAAVRQVLHKCVYCRRMMGPVQEQKMADLPSCRVDDVSPPFYNTGVDYFGPFFVKNGRKEVKRYGALFTCLTSRAIHLEVADSLETDTFINVLRRFIARRGDVKSIRSDNGTNMTGAEKELRNALLEMNQVIIQSSLTKRGIDWTFNPPSASHMGGSWERMIRSVRKILSGLLQEHGNRLDIDSFHTLLCEVEAIINSRPITTVSGDPWDIEPLTPNHILTGKSVVISPPPGIFQREDMYMRRRWRRVQYLANLFWSRWRNEYMLLLQRRQKWNTPHRNLKSGDVVLIKDDITPRCNWLLGLVETTETDKLGDVRAVIIKTQNSHLRRPINKLVLLVPNDK